MRETLSGQVGETDQSRVDFGRRKGVVVLLFIDAGSLVLSQSGEPLNPDWHFWGVLQIPCIPWHTENLEEVSEEGHKLGKAVGPQTNEDIEKELQIVSKSTRIKCSEGQAVLHIQ
jgi:hypothetical protein